MGTTVIALDGAFGIGLNMKNLTKLVPGLAPGYTFTNLNYGSAQLFPAGAAFEAGIDTLDVAIHSVPLTDDIVVLGMSLGSVTAGGWLGKYGASSTVSPSRLRFVLAGNSNRKYGGLLRNLVASNRQIPDDTPYSVINVAAQYDGWADWPTNLQTPTLPSARPEFISATTGFKGQVTGSSVSWTQDISADTDGILVFFHGTGVGTSWTVDINGQQMSLQASNPRYYPTGGGAFFSAAFGLINPATGTDKTFTITQQGGYAMGYFSATVVAYRNVSAFGPATTKVGTGSPASMAVPSAPGGVIAGAFHGQVLPGTFTGTDGYTTRVSESTVGGSYYGFRIAEVSGDQAPTFTATFTPQSGTINYYSGIAVPLLPNPTLFDQFSDILAQTGTMAGQNAYIGSNVEHASYGDRNLNDEHYDYTEGNITYRLYTTYPMPITSVKYPLGLFVSSYLSTMDAKVRPLVEQKYDRPEGTPHIVPLGGIESLEDSERLWNIAMARRALKERNRLKPAQIRLWDGDGVLRGEVAGWRDYEFEIVENDTGIATLELSLDHYLAKWVMDFRGREKRNVLVTFDKQGYRWSGFMDNYKVVHTKENDAYLVISFKHDYEQAKHILVWANPFLRPEVQFPKLWVIFGPAKWALLVTLFVNLMRLETSLWTLPDNPMDIRTWIPFSFDTSTWRNIVKPFPFLLDNSNLTIVFARFKPLHDVWKKDLQDAQLTVVCRRYIEGEDPHPFSDLQGELDLDFVEDLFSLIPLRHFVLVWDIVDKSGWGTETAFGGSLLTGLIRAVMNIAGDGTTEGIDIFTGDPTFPGEYYTPNFLGTSPTAPHVVYQDGLFNGITESEFTFFEATDTSFLTGGHSMPGVNEAFSAGVNMAGDFLTSIINTLISFAGSVGVGAGFFGAVTASVPSIDIPPLGGIMDAVAKILYEDTFLAFMEIPTLRAAPNGLTLPIAGLYDHGTSLGDLHYYEGWADGADRAFTLSAFMAVRAKIWATRARTVHTITVADAAPYIFGEKGYGDFGIGDRIGTTFREYPIANTIFMERVSKAKHGWGKDGSRGWKFTVGWEEPQDPAFKALDQVKEVNQALSTFGIL